MRRISILEPHGLALFERVLAGEVHAAAVVYLHDLDPGVVADVEDVLNIGDYTWVKVMEIDDRGRVNLSRKDALKEREAMGLKD